MSSSYRLELNRWLAGLDVRADRVLDIGGAQEKLSHRVKSWDVKEYLIADLPEPHANSPKPDIELDLNDEWSTQLVRQGKFIDKQFDTIFCLEVFDYVYDPMQAFSNIEWLLAIGGTAWVTFPFMYPTHQPIEDDSLRYAEGGIRKLAARVGLEIVQMIKRRPETTAIDNLWRSERMRAAKHYDHNFTGWIVEFRKEKS